MELENHGMKKNKFRKSLCIFSLGFLGSNPVNI